jgi:Methylpurine-DNA glycosylase (MPG)
MTLPSEQKLDFLNCRPKDGMPQLKLVTAPATCSVEPLRRAELPVDTIELAQYLIGKTLVHNLSMGRLSGRIVEVEGYPPVMPLTTRSGARQKAIVRCLSQMAGF